MVNASLTLADASVNIANSKVNANTNVKINGNISADSVNVTSNVNRTAYSTMNTESGGLVNAGKYNLLTETGGISLVEVTTDANNTINVSKGFDVNSKTNNKTETYLSENEISLIAVAKGEAKNNIDTQNKILVNGNNAETAGITAKNDNKDGTVNIKAENNNTVAMTKDSDAFGFISIKGGTLSNNINSNIDAEIKNIKISADDISLETDVEFGSLGTIQYNDKMDGFITSNGATIDNKITQNNNISIVNSELNAANRLKIAQKSNSDFHQEVESSFYAFAANNQAHSKLTVENNNTLDIDNNTVLTGDYLNISQDSSNNLSSKSNTNTHHVGFVDPVSESELKLTINNTINNNGVIRGNKAVQIDFMKYSENTLVQYANLYVEAAVATADCLGKLEYTTNNKFNINQNALVESGQDVIVNYSNGNNNLKSDIISKKVSRLLFGIPITVSNHGSNINQKINNSLALDGEVKAGANYDRYMLIDKNGNVDKTTLKGFIEGQDYSVVEGGTISGDELTQDAIKELQNQIDYINEQITKAQNDKQTNDEQIETYKNQLKVLESMLSNIDNSVSDDTAATTIHDNIQNAVVGEASDQLSQEHFDTIWNDVKEKEEADRNTYLDSYIVVPAETDDKGNVTKPAVYLTQAQKDKINNAMNAEHAKISTVEVNGVEMTQYNGQIIINESLKDDFVTLVNNTKDSIQSALDRVEDVNEGLDANIKDLNGNLTDLTNQKDYLSKPENKLPDVVVENSSIMFSDLVTQPAKIELNGILKSDITGNGQFKIFGTSLTVENYSDYDLIFQNITLNSGVSTGLMISGVNYNHLANTDIPVNDNVMLVKEYGDAKYQDNITINNYYDSKNPLIANAINSNITFNGVITNGTGALNVLNESGDILFNNPVNTKSKDIVATQRNVTYNAQNLILNKDDRILAGKNVTVNADTITNNGKVQAGYGDRNITITDEMLTHFVKDPVTGEDTEVIDLQGSDVSDYLSENNNIKILYTDADGDGKKEIVVFNTLTEGGNVTFNGKVLKMI